MCREHAATAGTVADTAGSRGSPPPFLTFAVVALHQTRLSDLYVEGFVLLVLLVVDHFHLDGFAEEAEEEGRKEGKEEEGRKEECRKSEETDRQEIGKTRRKRIQTAFGFPTSI